MEKVTIICYSKCTTCQKAEKWLKDNGIEYNYRPVKEENPTVKELTEWIKMSGFPVSRFFNTSGMLYREQNIKEKVKTLTETELIKILATDGMMVKRPIVLYKDKVLVGFKADEWERVLK